MCYIKIYTERFGIIVQNRISLFLVFRRWCFLYLISLSSQYHTQYQRLISKAKDTEANIVSIFLMPKSLPPVESLAESSFSY